MRTIEFESYNGRRIAIAVHERPDTVSEYIEANRRWFEHRVLEHVASKHPYHGTILDVGANIGNHSVFFCTYLNYKRLYAFEPHPDNLAVLQENLRQFENATALPVAIGAECGECGLATNFDTNLGMVRTVKGIGTDMRTIDSYGFDDVSLIKIDVEGLEAAVVYGAVQTIRRDKPIVVAEATTVPAFNSLMNVLSPLGYVCYAVLDEENPTYEFRHIRLA